MIDARTECEQLMAALVPFAEDMLAKHGEFFPFGGVVDPAGDITHVAVYEGDEWPKAAEVIERYRTVFTEGAAKGAYRATCLICDVRTQRPDGDDNGVTDAIRVALDHRDGFSIEVLFPYSIRDKQISVDEPFAHEGEYAIFAKPEDPIG